MADARREACENNQLEPDIRVKNDPDRVMSAGRDQQIEAAVRELDEGQIGLLAQISQGLEGGDAAPAGGRDDLKAAAGEIAGGEDAREVRPLEAVHGQVRLWSRARPTWRRAGRSGSPENEDGLDVQRPFAALAFQDDAFDVLLSGDLLDLGPAVDRDVGGASRP